MFYTNCAAFCRAYCGCRELFSFLTFFVRGAAAVVPAFINGLPGACHGKRPVRHILGHGRPAAVNTRSPRLTGETRFGIAADKAVVADDGFVLIITIVIDDHGAAAEIDPLADLRVADVGEMETLVPSPISAFSARRSRRSWYGRQPGSRDGYRRRGDGLPARQWRFRIPGSC